jgi:hypothetical protein
LILVRELEERPGFGNLIDPYLTNSRAKNARFTFADLLRQSVYSRLAGYVAETALHAEKYIKNDLRDGAVFGKLRGNEAIPGFPPPRNRQGGSLRGSPESFGMDRIKKRSKRRQSGVCWQVAGDAKWKSWIVWAFRAAD